VIVVRDSALVHDLHPSPNIGPRQADGLPSLLILHYTGMPSAAKAIDWLARPESKVSCHYVIDEQGRITQMVAEHMRAWHAGLSSWSGKTDINSASIGIEIQNPGHEHGYPEFPEPQMRAVAALSRDIMARNGIPPAGVLAHSDVAPARKIDPGEKFDWAYLARVGVGHWVEPAPLSSEEGGSPALSPSKIVRAQALLARYGYGVQITGELDPATACIVRAFQLHFRPQRVDGVIDNSTHETLERLVAALPASLHA
jgi:N-acetylmuramoyl-L-alanine amidase